jgi:hypothetical protein
MPILLERLGDRPLGEVLKEADTPSKILILEELMTAYTEWVGMVAEVLSGEHGILKDVDPYRFDLNYKIMKTLEKLYGTSDVYISLSELIAEITEE